jgi:uncharacterized protein with HEPN domain
MKDSRQESFVRLKNMIKSIEEIEKFTLDCSEKEFMEDAVLTSNFQHFGKQSQQIFKN